MIIFLIILFLVVYIVKVVVPIMENFEKFGDTKLEK